MFPLDLLGVSCGRDIDEALGIFPFTRDVSLGLLAVEEEEADADILGILETVEPAGGGGATIIIIIITGVSGNDF